MEKISILKNNFYYLKNDNSIKSLIISKNEIETLELKNYVLLLNSKNYYKYENKYNLIEIIEDIDLNKLKNIKTLENFDIFELANHISSKVFKKNIKLNNVIKEESYTDYQLKIKPYIESIYKDNTHWIYEIINGNREQENVLYQDDDFIILKELSMINSKNFYVLGFPIKKITCLREIKKSDLELLDTIVDKIKIFAKSISNIESDKLYIFFHYHPSFYQLHIHCTYIGNQLISNKFLRYHLYDKVKNNILKDENFYKKILHFEIPDNHVICKLLEK